MALGAATRRAPVGSIQGWGITRKTFNDIEDWMQDVGTSRERAQLGIGLLVRLMVFTTKGFAQQRSAGPVAPRHRSVPALAYRIPVQRITGRYFAGWTQRRMGPNHWLLYNESVEAYLIEYGVYQRTRRPILKLAILGMLRFLQTTRTADRFVDYVIGSRRERGRFQSFGTRAFGGTTMHGEQHGEGGPVNVSAGPQGRLPG